MSVIPCERNNSLGQQIEAYAETLKTEAHTLGDHGLSESDFYASGLFRGAIERIRGQFSADMREKREFVQHVLNYMQMRVSLPIGSPLARRIAMTTPSISHRVGQPSSS